MIVLHNRHDERSRAFVTTQVPVGIEIYDWYGVGADAWARAGGTLAVSAFPSVVHDVPAHTLPERLDTDGTVLHPAQTVDAYQAVQRLPADWTEVQAHATRIARLVALCAQALRTGDETAELWAIVDGGVA